MEKFSYDRADHAQTQNGNRPVVLLEGKCNVRVLRVHVGSPAKPAKDANAAQGTQQRASPAVAL